MKKLLKTFAVLFPILSFGQRTTEPHIDTNSKEDPVVVEAYADEPTYKVFKSVEEMSTANPMEIYEIDIEISKNNFPFEILKCKNLLKLTLRGNYKFLPKEIGELQKLKYLELSNSVIEIPDSFSNLTNLESLNLKNSEIDSYPMTFIQNLTKLKTLKIEGYYKELPSFNISNLSNLTYFELLGNFSDEMLNQISKLKKLKSLKISFLNQSEVNFPTKKIKIPSDWKNLTSLENLSFSSGYKELEWSNLSFPPNLVFLELFGNFNPSNELGRFPEDIWNLKFLKELKLRGVNFADLGVIKEHLPLLKKVNISLGRILSINSSIKNLTSLEDLVIDGLDIQKIDNGFSALKKLQTLSANNNRIENIVFVSGLSSLNSLHLESNRIKNIPDEIGTLSNLNYVKFQHNMIENLSPEIGRLKNLGKIELQYNKISSLPTEIGSCQKLEYIDASNNLIERIPNGISLIQRLYIFILSNNKITTFSEGILKLTKINNLDLSNNKITEIPKEIKNLKLLVQLNLDHNLIEKIPVELNSLNLLQSLRLGSNQIKELKLDFSAFQDLYVLNLNHNKITSLKNLNLVSSSLPKNFSGDSYLSIQLTGNPIMEIGKEQSNWLKERFYCRNTNIFNLISK